MENINDFQKILTDSNIGFILGGLLLKEDIQYYFSLVLTDIIEEYENSDESSMPLIFKVKDIYEHLLKEEEKFKKELKRLDSNHEKKQILKRKKKEDYLFSQLFKMNFPKDADSLSFCTTLTLLKSEEIVLKNKKESDIFVSNYIPDLSINDLIEIITKEKNINVKKYLEKKRKIIEKNNDIFNNKVLLGNMQKLKKSEKILFFYQKSFIISINLINNILDKFNSTLDAIPSSIKYISKIIYDLLLKKFKVDTIDIYKQVGYFFFMKLFKYIFLSPDYYPLFNNVILSENTKKNLFKIFEIFSQLISGDFYKSNEETSDYTPFNWYFIEKINIIYDLCKQLISTPSAISNNNDINNKNYFFSYSICFNWNIYETIINIINKKKNIIFKNNKYPKINEFKDLIDKLVKNKDINKPNEKTIINYFLYFEIIFSGVYNEIMNIDFSNKNFKMTGEINTNPPPQHKKSYSSIKSKESEKAELTNLITAKNLLSDILISIDENDLYEINNKTKNNSLKNILKFLKNYYESKTFAQKYMNFKNININNSISKNIPIEWHINSLLICLNKLNDTNTKNDYNNLYTTLSNSLKDSIKKYNSNFKLLSNIIENLKYTKYYIKYFKNSQYKYIELIINTKIKNFIEKEKINVIVKLVYNIKDKFLNIYVPDENKENEKNKLDYCKFMNDFISKFPNLSIIDKSQESELFEVEDKINLKGALNDFMNILKYKMLKYFKETEIDIAYEKIKKYILTKIYEKIYPQDYDNDDLLFFYKAISLSWIEPKHLKIPYEINVDNFIPITNHYFKQIDNEKSPSCKMNVITKIFNIINSALRFSLGENFSTDDIAPIFEYALIKARPERLSSNLRYLEFFISKGAELKNMYFDFLKNNMNSIKEINYTQFDGITEDEFKKKCFEANKSYIN